MGSWILTVAVCAAGVALAQQTQRQESTYTRDVHGRAVEGPVASEVKSASGRSSIENVRSINGVMVPLESVEERVLSKDDSGSVTERLVRRFDATGNPGPGERIRIEERKNPDGSSTTNTTVLRADINGRFEVAEKSRTETRAEGGATTATTTIERPAAGGGFDLVEKRVSEERKTAAGLQQDVATYRKDLNGSLYQALRQVTERSESGGQTRQTTSQYELGSSGELELAGRSVTRSTAQAEGGATTRIDIYKANVPGRAGIAGSGQLRLEEQQLIERRVKPEGVVESLSVRRPPADGSAPRGAYEKVSERVCRGQCQ